MDMDMDMGMGMATGGVRWGFVFLALLASSRACDVAFEVDATACMDDPDRVLNPGSGSGSGSDFVVKLAGLGNLGERLFAEKTWREALTAAAPLPLLLCSEVVFTFEPLSNSTEFAVSSAATCRGAEGRLDARDGLVDSVTESLRAAVSGVPMMSVGGTSTVVSTTAFEDVFLGVRGGGPVRCAVRGPLARFPVLLGAGAAAVLWAHAIGHSALLYYGGGVSLGALLSVVLLFWFVSRAFSQRSVQFGVLVAGVSSSAAAFTRVAWPAHWPLVAAYIAAASLGSLVYLYIKGPFSDPRALVVVTWLVRCGGGACILMSTQSRWMSALLLVLVVLLPPVWRAIWLGLRCARWGGRAARGALFPPPSAVPYDGLYGPDLDLHAKRERYRAETVRATEAGLGELRETLRTRRLKLGQFSAKALRAIVELLGGTCSLDHSGENDITVDRYGLRTDPVEVSDDVDMLSTHRD